MEMTEIDHRSPNELCVIVPFGGRIDIWWYVYNHLSQMIVTYISITMKLEIRWIFGLRLSTIDELTIWRNVQVFACIINALESRKSLQTKSNRTSSSPSLIGKWSLDQKLIQTTKSKTLMEESNTLALNVSFGERIQIFHWFPYSASKRIQVF